MLYSVSGLIKSSLKNLSQNKYFYLVTIFFLQVFLATVGRYSLAAVFRLALRMAGVTNLTKDNILDILGQTGPFFILLFYLLLLAGFIFFEFICLIYMVTRSYRYFPLKQMMYTSLIKLKWLSGPQLFLFLAYLILMIPLGNLGLTSSLLDRFRIPAFITGELTKSTQGSLLYYGVMALVFYLNIRLIYVLPLSVVNARTPWQNMKESWRLTRQDKRYWMLAIFSLTVILLLGGALFFLPVTLIFNWLDSTWSNIALQTLFYSLIRLSRYVLIFANKLIIIEVLLVFLFKKDEEEADYPYVGLEAKEATPMIYPKWTRLVLGFALLAFLVGNGLQLYLTSLNPHTLMIAHRGDVTAGVENSIEALESARQKGADLVEMDVVMTADQELVVIHDNDLGRLAGVDWKVSESQLADLEGLPIHQGKFRSKIDRFETYFQKAKALNQPLLIELKPYGHEPEDYVDLVIKRLRALGLRPGDKVMSLNLAVMEELERKAPEIETGYVIPLQFGVFDQHKVDFYVIEDFSYNDLSMWQAEQEGKEVYVWTINERSTMTNYLQSPVNGIITDDLALFKAEKEDIQEDDSYFARAMRLLSLDN
ncbi:glycerophosphoryl diester phosphodiesterase membrane domain-containing protein [Streptococcus ovuberis]|uniref:Glycerophosphodiester phosphodiesterase n=1 Tax=Streptococcus ovuberis TaxID=1936207 RepID=A0A7X6MZG0_9STRE|nr:glycerophosphodiester phosphodiesterase [Streptococcus ovuberis]NKZ20691.1 glycerophosphodiester phosphodiesterase [Streptococcus ovuberis]